MSKHAKTIVNAIINATPDGINKLYYLEVGTGSWGHTFWKINCKQKTAVDIIKKDILKTVPEVGPQGGRNMSLHDDYWDCGSDEFFNTEGKERRWDIIFIDGDHEYSQVVRDVNNALKRAKIVLVHDLIPPRENLARNHPTIKGMWSGDGYKLLYYIREVGFEHISLNEDYGLTLITNPPNPGFVPYDEIADITYEQFSAQRKKNKEYSLGEMLATAKQIPIKMGWK